jgi:DNA-binding HxlR family transcriptional regulator
MANQKQQTIKLDSGHICDPEKMDGMICCPISNTIELIGKKYALLILRNMMIGKHTRFNQFLTSIKGINPKILSSRLKEMEEEGLIKRTVYRETPIRVENRLTKKGMALKPILMMFAEFSMQYCSKDVFKDGKPKKLSSLNKEHPLSLIT